MVVSRIVSSLEKVFVTDRPEKFVSLERISALKGERISFQLACHDDPALDDKIHAFILHKVEIFGTLSKYARLRLVKNVPVPKPVSIEYDEHYLKTEPGIFPELLIPMPEGNCFYASHGMTNSVWVDLELPCDMSEVGESELILTVTDTQNDLKVSECKLTVDVLDAVLPEQTLLCTQWISYSSIWSYYGIEPYCERFYRIFENTLRAATKHGMNTLMLNVLGGSVEIKCNEGKYTFSFKRLKRIVDIAKSCGIYRFEIDHLFSAGSAEYSAHGVPMTVDGEAKTVFGGVSSTDPEYTRFLRALLKALIRYMKSIGEDKNLIFHIADEPSKAKIESFRAARNSVIDIIDGYMIIDALFDIEYYKEGLVTNPVPINSKLTPFIEAGVPGLWTYYCCGPGVKHSNRFISMPSAQNRSLGMQLYKYRLSGFLHWGFNYYHNESGTYTNIPFLENSGESWVSGGDTFLVYPLANDGILESLRLLVFHDGLQDMRAMQLCESLYSHEEVVAAIEEAFGGEIRFDTCAYTSRVMHRIREKVNTMIKEKISK